MSTFNYIRTRSTAEQLIARFGQAVTLKRTAAGGAVTTHGTRGIVVGTVKHVLDGSGIAIGDDRLILDNTVAPEPGDRIAYNGTERVVVDPVLPLNPAGVVLLYECYARAG